MNSAVKCKLLCNLSSQLQSVCSVMICQLGSSLLAQSVSSAAIRQLSCDVSTQLSCCLKAQLQLVNSAISSAGTCQLSCTLLAQMRLVISAATCWLSCSLSPHMYFAKRQIWRSPRGSVLKCLTKQFQKVVLILTYSTSAEPAARSSPENTYCESKVREVPLRGYYRALGTSLSPILCFTNSFWFVLT